MTELLLGCGSTRDKRLFPTGERVFRDLTTIDHVKTHHPTHVHDLNVVPWPVDSNAFDEVHAYEVLEHLGGLGDERSFFSHFTEIWRVLKPGGYLCATVPAWDSMWAFGDPSHRRVISPGSLVFLDQAQYVKQVGKTSMSDFRAIYKADFTSVFQKSFGGTFQFILQAIKPSRLK